MQFMQVGSKTHLEVLWNAIQIRFLQMVLSPDTPVLMLDYEHVSLAAVHITQKWHQIQPSPSVSWRRDCLEGKMTDLLYISRAFMFVQSDWRQRSYHSKWQCHCQNIFRHLIFLWRFKGKCFLGCKVEFFAAIPQVTTRQHWKNGRVAFYFTIKAFRCVCVLMT